MKRCMGGSAGPCFAGRTSTSPFPLDPTWSKRLPIRLGSSRKEWKRNIVARRAMLIGGTSPLEFGVGDYVFLKVSPTKEITRFNMIGKLSPSYFGPYPITQWVGKAAYRLELPPKLPRERNVYHVSQLRWYVQDPSHVIKPGPIHLQEDFSYDANPWRKGKTTA